MKTPRRRDFEQTALPQLDTMYRCALRLTNNPAEAEDLVQDAYVRAYRFWDTFQPGSSAKAWLLTILRNTFINGYHRTNRRKQTRHELEAQLSSLGQQTAVARPAVSTNPENALDRKLTRERIASALATIPEDYRIAVTLADLEGLAYKEIAEVMDCPIGTVMSRIYRGRRLLHKLLLEHAQELGLAPDSTDTAAPEGAIDMNRYRTKRGTA
jgi:RNA polymerase sigma-70 factor (ECF subfamily)